MIDIIKLLKENNAVSDFRVKYALINSYEGFYVHKQLETVRSTNTVDCHVTVYVKGENGMGDSGFSIYESTTESSAKEKIQKAVERAKMAMNKPYDIVSGEKEEYKIASSLSEFSMAEICDKIATAVFKADCLSHGSLNAVEVFVYKTSVRIVNSRGVDKTQVSYRAMIEAIPTWTENGSSVELYESYNFTEFNEEDIVKEIEGRMREVRDRQIAVKPQTPFNCNVLLGAKEISSLIGELTYGLNYASVYSHANVHSVGDKIQSEILGDGLTVTMKNEIKGSRFSAYFDDDGLTLTSKKIIDNGEVVGYYGSSRFGQYLGEKQITGGLMCVSVDCGSLTEEQLKGQTYLELVSLSGLQLDLYNDYIGGEIRLAYLHQGEKVTAVTGISISGSLSKTLKTIRFATQSKTREAYEGPAFALLNDLTVV